MSVITRRQIAKLLQEIASNHYQIHTFGWGDVPELLGRQGTIYPFMMVTPESPVMGEGEVTHRFRISIADRLQKGIENIEDVDSDMYQLLRDIITQIDNVAYQDMRVDLPVTIEPFRAEDAQDVYGFSGVIDIIVDEDYDQCAIPSDDVPFDPVPPPSCLPATYRVEFASGTIIEEGTIDSGESKTIVVPDCENATWTLVDANGIVIDTGSIAAGGSATITAPNGVVTIQDSNGSTLYVVNVASGGSETQAVGDSTATVRNSNGVVVDTASIPTEGSADLDAPDASVTVNGVAFKDVASGESGNIEVRKSSGSDLIGSKQAQSWRIGDSTITNDATSPTYTANVKATEPLVLPRTDIEVNGVLEGDVKSVDTVEIEIVDDNDDPVTPTSVDVTGQVVKVEVPKPPPTGEHLVRFFDIDGTILKEEWVDNGNDATAPSDPEFDPTYLTFAEWNQPFTNVQHDLDVGAIYDTIDGKTYLFIRITDTTGLQPTIRIDKFTTDLLTIDWGDSTTSTTSSIGDVSLTKGANYSIIGDYVISIDCVGKYSNTRNFNLFNSETNYELSCLKAYMGETMRADRNCMRSLGFMEIISVNKDYMEGISDVSNLRFFVLSCGSLKHITIPSSPTNTLASAFFAEAQQLATVSIPASYLDIESNVFNDTHKLRKIIIPNHTSIGSGSFRQSEVEEFSVNEGITEIPSACFLNANTQKLKLPNSLEIVRSNGLRGMRNLSKIEFFENLHTIEAGGLRQCFTMLEITFHSTTPPSITSNSLQDTLSPATKIYVPDASVTAYKTATNWSVYEDYIYPLSTKP